MVPSILQEPDHLSLRVPTLGHPNWDISPAFNERFLRTSLGTADPWAANWAQHTRSSGNAPTITPAPPSRIYFFSSSYFVRRPTWWVDTIWSFMSIFSPYIIYICSFILVCAAVSVIANKEQGLGLTGQIVWRQIEKSIPIGSSCVCTLSSRFIESARSDYSLGWRSLSSSHLSHHPASER